MICKHNINDNFSLTLNNTRPQGLDYVNSIDMTYINKVNDKSSYILKSTWLPGPGHKSSIDMIYKNNVIDNFFLL